MHRVWSPLRIVGLVCVLSLMWYSNVPGKLLAAIGEAESCCGSPSIVATLQTTQSQLELYAATRNYRYPTLDQLQHHWSVMVVQTHDTNGDMMVGPFFEKPPINFLTNSSTVAAPGQATIEDGWDYDETTGMIRAVIPDNQTYQDLFKRGLQVVQPTAAP